MNTMTEQKRGRPRAKLSKVRISPPMVSPDALLNLEVISDQVGTTSVASLIAQVAEAAKHGKADNWHRAVAAFQDAIEK